MVPELIIEEDSFSTYPRGEDNSRFSSMKEEHGFSDGEDMWLENELNESMEEEKNEKLNCIMNQMKVMRVSLNIKKKFIRE